MSAEEPDYQSATNLGGAALPYLKEFVRDTNASRAARAVHLAARIGGAPAAEIVDMGIDHADPRVRIAVARALSPDFGAHLLPRLMRDKDRGVRLVSVQALQELLQLEPSLIGELLDDLTEVSESDVDPNVRRAFQEVTRRFTQAAGR